MVKQSIFDGHKDDGFKASQGQLESTVILSNDSYHRSRYLLYESSGAGKETLTTNEQDATVDAFLLHCEFHIARPVSGLPDACP